jgi:hypothetical protein
MKTIFSKIGRPAFWGCAAAFALMVAVLAGRSDAGAQRMATVVSSFGPGSSQSRQHAAAGPPPSEMETVTRQLVQTVRGLTDDDGRLATRLAAVERNLDDMTGSISRQIEAVKGAQAAAPPWPDDPAATSPSAIAAMIAPPNPAPPGVTGAAADDAPSPIKGYGADIGGAASIKSLHARWVVLRAARPQLFDGLRAGVTIRESAKSTRVQLRLVAGPFASADAAAQFCASLTALKVPCQPTMFDGRLALQ